MVDDQFSRAVVAYIGLVGRLSPESKEQRVIEAIGDGGLEVLSRVVALLEEVYAVEPPLWSNSNFEPYEQVESWLWVNHPELSRNAMRAIANQYAFDYR
jgi:hypothetical protein